MYNSFDYLTNLIARNFISSSVRNDMLFNDCMNKTSLSFNGYFNNTAVSLANMITSTKA